MLISVFESVAEYAAKFRPDYGGYDLPLLVDG